MHALVLGVRVALWVLYPGQQHRCVRVRRGLRRHDRKRAAATRLDRSQAPGICAGATERLERVPGDVDTVRLAFPGRPDRHLCTPGRMEAKVLVHRAERLLGVVAWRQADANPAGSDRYQLVRRALRWRRVNSQYGNGWLRPEPIGQRAPAQKPDTGPEPGEFAQVRFWQPQPIRGAGAQTLQPRRLRGRAVWR